MAENDPKRKAGASRRDFLRGSSLAAATAVLTNKAVEAAEENLGANAEANLLQGSVNLKLKVNGEEKSCMVEPRSTLLDTLRDRLDITGPKRVCDRGACGSCTAIVDGASVYTCTMLAVTAQGKTVTTVESFDTGEKGVPHAFHQHDGLMCGYCTPGFVTACKALLDKNPNPTPAEVRKGLDGSICRCGTYSGVLEAAMAAAKAMKGA